MNKQTYTIMVEYIPTKSDMVSRVFEFADLEDADQYRKEVENALGLMMDLDLVAYYAVSRTVKRE